MTTGLENSIVRADSAVELIVWLVIAVIWAIAQVVARARQKKEGVEPPPAPTENHAQDLDEFFKLLRQQFEAGQARPAAPPTIRKRAAPAQAPRTQEQKVHRTTASSVLSHRAPAQPPIEIPKALTTEEPWTDFTHTPKVSFESIRRDILSLKAGFSSRGLQLPVVRMTSRFRRQTSPVTRALLQGRQRLKAAVVARVVLGAPRSVRPWLYPED